MLYLSRVSLQYNQDLTQEKTTSIGTKKWRAQQICDRSHLSGIINIIF